MIGYFTVGTDNPEAALKFYDTLFSNVRKDRLCTHERMVA